MIGLLTFHDTTNFGSYLQTYGLYKKIIDLGADCEIIDYQCKSIVDREIPKSFHWSFNLKKILIYFLFKRNGHKKYKELSSLFRALMKHSKPYSTSNIQEANDRYSTIVIGSDIVWGMDITNGDLTYYLDFANNKISKYSFSASIGNKWSEEDKKKVAPLLSRFDEINVREIEAANWITELLPNKKVDVVCDPTMLLTVKDWARLESNRYVNDKYVLVYFETINCDCLRAAQKYAKLNNLKVYYINYGKPKRGVKNIKPSNVGDFLSLIHNASFVVTASYHGMLFSIYYNKQFIFYNRAHKSRMYTLAEMLKVQNRNGEVCDVSKIPTINYTEVNREVEKFRLKSIKKLENIILHERNL